MRNDGEQTQCLHDSPFGFYACTARPLGSETQCRCGALTSQPFARVCQQAVRETSLDNPDVGLIFIRYVPHHAANQPRHSLGALAQHIAITAIVELVVITALPNHPLHMCT